MNVFESLLSAEFIRAFAWTLFHSIWQGGLLALVAAGLMIILRKHRPGIRYTVLYIFLILLPVIFAGTFLMTYNPGNSANHTNTVTADIKAYQNTDITLEMPAVTVSEKTGAWYVHSVRIFENQAKWLVLIWFTGFLIFLLRFSGSILYVYRLKKYQVFQVGEQWNTNLERLSGRIGLRQQVRLAESALARIPMTIGYLKPVILLPLGTLSGVPPQQIDAILLHELAHILRKDYLLNIIQSFIELLFFYHPVTWWLSGLIRQEREHICDDLAIGVNHDHVNYIKALTTMEELNSKSPLLASAMTGSKKKLLIRVKRLLTPVKLRKGFGEGIIAFILLIGLIFTLSLNALSIIPSKFDLTGRESGERIYNMLPFNPEIPDTVNAISKSGKVKISIYTDSTSQVKQEQLQQMAESMDKQTQHYDQARKEYMIQMEMLDTSRIKCDEQRKVIVISPEPKRAPHLRYYYSQPDVPREKDCSVKVFSYMNDSIDTLIIVRPDEHLILNDLEDFEWSVDVYEDQLRDAEREIEAFQWSSEEWPPPGAPMRGFSPEYPVNHAEKIIRQELRDDGLTEGGRKYVFEIGAKAMYINGEKQPKETFRKYSKLVESLEQIDFEGDETFKLIF